MGFLPRLALSAVLSCSAILPAPALAQPELPSTADRQRALVERIEQIRLTEGPFSSELIEPLSALALLYEESGDARLAFATNDSVRQLMRARHGLYSLEQAPSLAKLIDAAESGGDPVTAWNLEQELLEITSRNAEDLRSAPILRHVADKRIDLIERYIAGERPPQIELGCYYTIEALRNIRGCRAGSMRKAVSAILTEAEKHYRRAIDILMQHELYSSEDLIELEMDIVRSHFKYGKYFSGAEGCRRAHASLVRIYDYYERSAASLATRAEALVQAADYELLCQWSVSALNSYKTAIALLDREGAPQSLIDRFFSPATPVYLPTFVDSVLRVRDADSSTAYVDVSFSVTRFGASRKIEVLNGKGNPGVENVVSAIRRGRFRPIAQDGEFVDSPRFVVRYFLEN